MDDQGDRPASFPRQILAIGLTLSAIAAGPIGSAGAQPSESQLGGVVSPEVREIYDRGLQFLAGNQRENGSWGPGEQREGLTRGLETSASWDDSWSRQADQGPGVTGLALLALLASGDDANFGTYSNHIRKGLRSLIRVQDAKTGHFGPTMYHHGFAMLALAEAYGMVNEQDLWPDGAAPRSIGQALQLAVGAAIAAQESNPNHAWRYVPNSKDADSSISGAILVGLLAARNAGIDVPDSSIDRAILYFRSMTRPSGDVFYLGQTSNTDTMARTSITNLVFAIAHRKDLPEYRSTLAYLVRQIEGPTGVYLEYVRYYEAQALFQGDIASWERWNRLLIRQIMESQSADGSIRGRFGPTICTSLSLLSLALNYRFLPIYER